VETNCITDPQLSPLPPPEVPPAAGKVLGQNAVPLPVWKLEVVPMPAPQPVRRTRPAARRASVKAGPWLAAALQTRWESYCAQLQRCREEPTEEAVHELRVATRRLIAQLFLLSAVVPGAAPGNAHRFLKERLKALGELRDVQMLRRFFDGQTSAFPELILVRDALARLERRLIKLAGRQVARFKSRKLENWIAGITDDLTANSGSRRVQRALHAAVLRATDNAFREVVERRLAIDALDLRTIHRPRVAFKKFRYMVESLSPAITGLGRKQLGALARYQRKMGAIQDLGVILSCVTEYLENHGYAQPLFERFCRFLRRRRARAVATFVSSADGLFAFWPPPAGRGGA